MTSPVTEIRGCATSHAALNARIAGLTDDDIRGPSRLPGWSVGHLLTHIARNADSVVRRLDGAKRDEIVDQYVGGAEGRAAEIEAGAHRSAAELIEDVRSSSDAVDAISGDLPEQAWDRLTRGVSGLEVPASTVIHQRWREVEIHLVDLDVGYSTADFPVELIDRMLDEQLPRLGRRADRAALVAWVLGRGDAPELGPWG